MQLTYKNKEYDIVIEKKKSNRNTYIRVKKDLVIYVTTNFFTSIKSIEKLIEENYKRIGSMIEVQEAKSRNNNGFYYLGAQYIVIYSENPQITIENNKIYVPHDFDIDKWYKNEAKKLFLEHFEDNYKSFSRKIPHPSLRIRKMTTRWGVCNIKTHTITLNLELIKRDTCYLDYVIVHEMSHLIYGDHSKAFWKLVEENMPEYKKYRDEMKEF